MPSFSTSPPPTVVIHHLDSLVDLGPWSSLEYRTIARECRDSGWQCVALFAKGSSENPAENGGEGEGLKVLSELEEQASLDGLEILRINGNGECGPRVSVDDDGDKERKEIALSTSWERTVFSDDSASISEIKKKICLLDPKAETDLSPADARSFHGFLVGGILGDDPPRDRTSELRGKGYEGRRLGPKQMTTDTAVRVARMVVQEQVTLDEIPYLDYPELKLDEHESTQMPFRYVRGEDGKPVMPEGMIGLIKRDADKSFDDFLES